MSGPALLPHPPASPCPRVPAGRPSPLAVQLHLQPVARIRCSPVLCCASPGRTSRKHRASHRHGTRLLPRCSPGASPKRDPRRGAHTPGSGWGKPRHRQAAEKAVLIAEMGYSDLDSGGKDGFDSLCEGEDACLGAMARKETQRKEKPTSSALRRFTDVAPHCAAKVEGLLSSPRSRGRLTLVIFSRRQG